MSKPLALIVEDNIDLADILASALQTSGFEVETIHDGAKALARLAEIVPALVILDLHLPHLSGANALRQIQTDRRLLNTRVVIATADAAMADELRDKADLVLLKPVSIAQIRDLASRLIPSARTAQVEKNPEDTLRTAPMEKNPEDTLRTAPMEKNPEDTPRTAQAEKNPEGTPRTAPMEKNPEDSSQPPSDTGNVTRDA
jgi:CheY-like chemotaxis protein